MAAPGRSKGPPRDLVRFSPLQFSAAVAVVVILAAGSYLFGYLHGARDGRERMAESVLPQTVDVSSNPPGALSTGSGEQKAVSPQPVTFYSALTEKQPSSTPKENITRAPLPTGAKPQAEDGGAPPPKAVRETPAAAPPVMIQVASYPTKDKAQELLASLVAAGYQGKVVAADLGPRGVWYRVHLGPVPRQDASSLLTALEKDRGIKGFVVRN